MATSLVNTLFASEGEVVSELNLSSRPDLSSSPPFLFLTFALVSGLGDEKTAVLTILLSLLLANQQIFQRRKTKRKERRKEGMEVALRP